MKKQIEVYPYYGKQTDEKLFLSEIILLKIFKKRKKFTKTSHKNRKTIIEQWIKSKIKKRKRAVSVTLITAFFYFLPVEPARGMGTFNNYRTPLPEINRPVSKPNPRPAIDVPKPRDKITYSSGKEISSDLLPLMVLYSNNFVNDELVKKIIKLNGGDDSLLVKLIWISLLVYGIANFPNEAEAFLNALVQANNPNVPHIQKPGFIDWHRDTIDGTSRVQAQKGFSIGNADRWPWHRPNGDVCSQSQSFVDKDGTINVQRAYQEVLRRTRNSSDFRCSYNRFKELCIECGEMTPKSCGDAITALQLEADGIVTNVRRDPIAQASGVKGADFLIDSGPNGNETHLEIKSPVSSKIRLIETGKSSHMKQAKLIAGKIEWQIRNWSKPISERPVNQFITTPKRAQDVFVVIDEMNVPVDEKLEVQQKIQYNLIQKNVSRAIEGNWPLTPIDNIMFINNVVNR